MKLNDPQFPTFSELGEGDRVLVVRADGVVGLADVSLLGGSSGGGGEEEPPEPEFSMVAGSKLLVLGAWQDTSGNNNHLSPVNANPAYGPILSTGLDNQPCLRWQDSNTGEVQAQFFLAGATSATLQAVITIAYPTNHYNFGRTNGSDDYWQFNGSGNGYFKTFRNTRFEAFPQGMPTVGSHLIEVVSTADEYEVFVDTVSKGKRPTVFDPGYWFRLGELPGYYFRGDLLLESVYASALTPEQLLQNRQFIKNRFPSLPFTL